MVLRISSQIVHVYFNEKYTKIGNMITCAIASRIGQIKRSKIQFVK